MVRPEKTRQSRASQVAQAYRAANEVVSGAMSMAICVGGGYWVDKNFGWSPILTICGACLGFTMAGLSLRRLLLRLDAESERKKRQAAETGRASQE